MLRDWRNNRRLRKANLLYGEGRHLEAGRHYEQLARSSEPETALQMAMHSAQCFHSIGAYEHTLIVLDLFDRRFAEIEDADWEDWRAAAHATRSSVYRMQRRFDEALSEARIAADLHATPSTLYTLAIALKHNGHLDDAIAILNDLVETGGFEYRIPLAGYLFLAGQTDLAEMTLSMVSKGDISEQLSNMAWLSACQDKRTDCFEFIRRSYRRESAEYLDSFYRNEVEFDRFREDPEFEVLVRGRGGRR